MDCFKCMGRDFTPLKPLVIAEIGVNYYDIAKKEKIPLLDAAKLMISAAKKGGANSVKFQSYKADRLADKNAKSYWDNTQEIIFNQHELFSKFDKFGESEYKELSRYCRNLDILFLSTPFDFESVDYLEKLVPLYKISSSDINNIPLIEYISGKNKPILLSTGASNIDEIDAAVKTIKSFCNNPIVLLHCILNYPTKYQNANLGMIKDIKKKFPQCYVGYSDHTIPDESMLVLVQALMLGSVVIEKHFTLDKKIAGNDHYHSMDSYDLSKLTKNIEFLNKCYGSETKKSLPSEKKSRLYARRSIFALENISKNSIITKEILTYKRPGTGIPPSQLKKVIGCKAKIEISKDAMIEDFMIDKNQ
jgi:sialic acid synthase SpsE